MSRTMPEVVRQVYDPLWQAVGILHLNWKLFRQVYGTSPERIELLNEFAPNFFRAVQDSLLDSTFLAITRLTDGPKSVGKDNLVLGRLILAVEEDEQGLSDRLGLPEKIRGIEVQCVTFRSIRNKRLAHNDLKAVQQGRAENDAPMTASRQHVEEALVAIRDFMNTVQAHYLDGETKYELLILSPGDGDALIHHLEDLKKRRIETPRSPRWQ